MNYIKHLTAFFDRVSEDWSLNPTHVSLYIALFHYWNISRFQNPISLTRGEVMRISKISSKATYHKCIKDLNDKGYIKYEPSNNPYKGSLAILYDFSVTTEPVQKTAYSPKKNLPKNELVVNKQRTSNETSTGTSIEQALVSSINMINNTNNLNIENNLNLEEQAKNFENENVIARNEAILEKKEEEKEKSSAKKEMFEILADDNQKIVQTFATADKKQTEKSRQKENTLDNPNEFSQSTYSNQSRITNKEQRVNNNEKPSIEEVKAYFLQQNFPEHEANKFFNYFSSVGWLIGGKIPMVDWQAAAQNWMLNAIKFKSYEKPPDRAKHLNTENDKDYSEPL